ncbi:restriction endonuclease subunit S [Cyanobacterium aponinum FACHB-4101]|uniref:restriction endonuclease subunit S n=1 Tax=Cyanobacterium aponinum TaxID=379064 RepID=UPI00167FEB02|nr:restriction endonuclease subunit S [Cyanobacterium aponinum]MBD2395852.1 restriction endonuclease subunit S [Cyanobacterium aponinum FACHB-4101]
MTKVKIPDGWQETKLSKLLTIRNGKDHKNLKDGKYPVLGTGGVIRYVDSYLYDQPSILIGRKGTIDKPQFITSPFWTVDTLFYSEISPDVIPFFLFKVVQSVNWQQYNQATGVPSLTATTINNVKVCIPSSKNEQKKIAEILGTCDRTLELTEKLINAKRKLKQALMQKLLTGKLRFPEFEGQKWKVTKSGKVIKFFGGNAFSSNDSCESGIRWLKIANVGIESVKWDDISFLPQHYQNQYKDYLLHDGDIVMALTRPILNNRLKICKLSINDVPSLLNQRVAKISVLNNSINNIYIYFLLQTRYFINSMNSLLMGNDPPNIGIKDLENIQINFPTNKDEQIKIAECLNSLEKMIINLEQQKELLTKQKKGLMQQLLTGKIRVNQ